MDENLNVTDENPLNRMFSSHIFLSIMSNMRYIKMCYIKGLLNLKNQGGGASVPMVLRPSCMEVART